MNLLFIIPYVPSKVRVRPYQIIRHLKERGHRITLATIVTNQQEQNDLDHFKQYCDEIIMGELPTYRSLINSILALPTRLPLQSVYSWDARLFSQITERISNHHNQPKFDLIHIEHLRGSQYGVLLQKRTGSNSPPIVWDSVDCISHLFRQAADQSQTGFSRLITQFDLPRTERREGQLTTMFDQVLVTSANDKNALQALTKRETDNIQVLPNGVDLDYFKPDHNLPRETSTLVISGKMSYHANISMVLYFTNKIFPIVQSTWPDVKLWIVGKDPSKEILALADNPSITVTGYVDSILPYLQKASVAVAPLLYGAGIQNKVLEAMACATPVVSSPQAVSAISAEPGKDILIGETPEEFAQALVDLLSDARLRRQIGEAGRSFVEQNHHWKKICQQLETIYGSLIC